MIQWHALCFFLILHLFPRIPTTITAAAAAEPAYTASDFVLLNCGASANLSDSSGRTWDGDADGHSAASALSSASKASNMHPSVSRVPFETASFFLSNFTYIFSLQTTGPKFLRLYFYPGIYSGFNTSLSFFSVAANSFILLNNFSAHLSSPSPSQPSFMKEFVINIDENMRLDLTLFTNPKSFAFINGIEIVSVPDELYFRGNDKPIRFEDRLIYLNNTTIMENLYRLNVGGSKVEIQDDSGAKRGMFRSWSPDYDYIRGGDFGGTPHAENLQINYTSQTPPYSAPAVVYTTSRVSNYSKSLEWRFVVDSGNHYLLRLHFCEIQPKVTEQNQRVFTISINNQTAEIKADIILWTGGNGIPIFRDYITRVPDSGLHGKQELLLSLIPYIEGKPKYNSTVLNGLEIFKLKYFNRSAVAGDPETAMSPLPPPAKKKRRPYVMYAVIGIVIRLLTVVAGVSFLIFKQRKAKGLATKSAAKSLWDLLSTSSKSKERTSGSGVTRHNLCRYFSLDEIKTATHDFDDNCVIGKGGFGDVYKGNIHDGTTTVAIKRLNPLSNQGAREFLTEIEMLSNVRHLHLVSLIGYCDESGEMILVYDYMANGTLRDHLYNSEKSPITWKQRLQICIGAAKGLHYLHTGTKQAIIHRDVKSTNILLDEKWVAKISDFGLSKMGPANDSFTHISTNIKGTFGYLDPEYFLTSKLTRKSDVYAFGVVLFEVLSTRPAVDMKLDDEQHGLAGWARHCIQEGKLDQLIDNSLIGQISPACLESFVGIGGRCLHTQPQQRPTMADIVKGLELALALLQTTNPTQQVEATCNHQSNGDTSFDENSSRLESKVIVAPAEKTVYHEKINGEVKTI